MRDAWAGFPPPCSRSFSFAGRFPNGDTLTTTGSFCGTVVCVSGRWRLYALAASLSPSLPLGSLTCTPRVYELRRRDYARPWLQRVSSFPPSEWPFFYSSIPTSAREFVIARVTSRPKDIYDRRAEPWSIYWATLLQNPKGCLVFWNSTLVCCSPRGNTIAG